MVQNPEGIGHCVLYGVEAHQAKVGFLLHFSFGWLNMKSSSLHILMWDSLTQYLEALWSQNAVQFTGSSSAED